MNYKELTVEAQDVLLTFYKAYIQRIKNGESRDLARIFGTINEVHNQYFKKWNIDDLQDIIRELSCKQWLRSEYGSNVSSRIELSTKSIAFLQNKFSNGLQEIIEELIKLKNLLF